jgi:hypothetical protein
MNTLPLSEWIERCALRIVEIDQQIARDEARGLAQEFRSFERSRHHASSAAPNRGLESPKRSRLCNCAAQATHAQTSEKR